VGSFALNPETTASLPTLSVVVPNYNHGRFLRDSLRAILAQSFLPLEVIVVDDGSTDGSVEILREFAREHAIIRVIENAANAGVVANMNRLLEMAAGEYICFAAADDKVLPGMFEASLTLLARHKDAGFCSGLCLIIDEEGQSKGMLAAPLVSATPRFFSSSESKELLRKYGPWVVGNTVVYRRDVLLESGGFDPNLAAYCDGFLHLVLALRHGACFVPAPFACWRRLASGYAASTHADVERSIQIAEYGARLMRTKFADLFEEGYIRDWERYAVYQAGVGGWRDIAERQARLIAAIGRRAPGGRFQQGLLALARVLVRIQALVVQFLLAAAVWFSVGNLARKVRATRWFASWFAPVP
jgi:glycosyltransferase involved in cell wall biosynthesis